MISGLIAIALLASQQQRPARASIAGIVVRAGTNQPVANVLVTLAKIDNTKLSAFVALVGRDAPPMELVIPGEQLPLINAVTAMEANGGGTPNGPSIMPTL